MIQHLPIHIREIYSPNNNLYSRFQPKTTLSKTTCFYAVIECPIHPLNDCIVLWSVRNKLLMSNSMLVTILNKFIRTILPTIITSKTCQGLPDFSLNHKMKNLKNVKDITPIFHCINPQVPRSIINESDKIKRTTK